MSIFGLIAGAILFLLVYKVGHHYSDKKTLKNRNLMIMKNKNEKLFITSASVSTDLVPLLESHLTTDDKMVSVGTGGYFLTRNQSVWTNGLSKFCSKGIAIDYILIDPSPSALRKIQEYFNTSSELFSTYILSSTSLDENEKRLATKLKTNHPTIIESSLGQPKLMWIEAYHPEDSVKAYDIEYTPPNKFDEQEKKHFEDWKAIITECKQHGHPMEKNEETKIAA